MNRRVRDGVDCYTRFRIISLPKVTRPNRVGESLKIGDVARRLGISASMVRAWERLGLARPARTDSKYRIYTDADLRALRRAVYLRRVEGLNAAAILPKLRQEGLLQDAKSARPEESSTLGPQLRKLRLQQSKSLSTVADAVGVSIGFLSNLERSQSGASIGIMRKLAKYYGVNILDFFNPVDATGPLVRPRDRRILEGGAGVQMELLASGKIIMEPHLFRVQPEAGSGESYAHEGEEFLYIISGRLSITVNEEEFQLRAGDSFYFSSQMQHSWSNPGKTETVILWINTPPTF
jgi:DNA-binding transcriptional MerR regulator